MLLRFFDASSKTLNFRAVVCSEGSQTNMREKQEPSVDDKTGQIWLIYYVNQHYQYGQNLLFRYDTMNSEETLTNLWGLVIYPIRCMLYLPLNDKGIYTWGQNQFVDSLVSVFTL